MKKLTIITSSLIALLLMASTVAAAMNTVWDQGFETDTSGWYGTITRVATGNNGITSSEGSWHAIVTEDGSGPFSRFDGYRDTWTNSFTAEVDVYLDPSWVSGSGFDYSVATTGSDGNHQRDYIFHVTKDTSTGSLLVGGSNNTNFAVREDLENINHYEITTAGWYTLQHVFYDNGGALAVDLNLLDDGGNVLFTETRYNAADTIPAEVGGNRYAWFTFISVPSGLAIDEHQLMFYEPENELLGSFNGGGQLLEEIDGAKKKDWLKISFGGEVMDYSVTGLEGEFEVNFHNVGDDTLDKTKFHTTDITDVNFFEGNSDSCEAAFNFTAEGEYEGESGYELTFRSGDNGSPNTEDTVRIELRDPEGGLVYDTHASGEFTDESSCVGTARTGLDNGNITIMY